MLAQLSIRDIVLIDRLDIEPGGGLTVLTGETGAGKSILLDAFALALGARGDGALVREGQPQGQVTAVFDLPPSHPAVIAARAADIDCDGELILRRVQMADGRTRAFVNDQPISVQALRSIGSALVEIHGQHDDRALVDPAMHRALIDAAGGLEPEVAAVRAAYASAREARDGARERRRAHRERAQGSRLASPRARRADEARARAERRARTRRQAHRHDAGREGRDRIARRQRHDERRPCARLRHAVAAAPPRPARRAGARVARALGEGARRGANGGRRRRADHRRSAARLRFRSARTGAHRGTLVRAARRRPQVRRPCGRSRGARGEIRERSCGAGCGRGASGYTAQGRAGSGCEIRRARSRVRARRA